MNLHLPLSLPASAMEVESGILGSGDACPASWGKQAEAAEPAWTEVRKGNNKRLRKNDNSSDRTARSLFPFSLQNEHGRKEAVEVLWNTAARMRYELSEVIAGVFKARFTGWEQKPIEKTANLIACMIAEYHLMCTQHECNLCRPLLPADLSNMMPPVKTQP